MNLQNGLLSEQRHDPETGELRDPPGDPASLRALNAARMRRQWDHVSGIVVKTPPEAQESQYEIAFLAAQMEIAAILETDAKAQITDKRSYTYASLGNVLAHVRPILHKNGLTLKQGTGRMHKMGIDGGNMLYLPVFTQIKHAGSGESETFVMEMPMPKLDPQAVGAATSYGKRYSLLGALGIATADDDAIAAITQRSLTRDDEAEMVGVIIEKIKACKTIEELQKWGAQNKQGLTGLSEESYNKCRTAYGDRLKELQEAAPEANGKKGK